MPRIESRQTDCDLEATDELPVLSEAAIVALGELSPEYADDPLAATDEHRPQRAGFDPAPRPVDDDAPGAPVSGTESSTGDGHLAALQKDLAALVEGWRSLASRLERNSDAIEALTELHDAADSRETQAAAFGQAMAARQDALADAAAEREARLEAALADSRAEVKRLTAALAAADAARDNADATLSERAAAIAALESELAAAHADAATRTAAATADRAEIEALTAYITNRRAHWDALEARAAEQSRRISELEAEVEHRRSSQRDAEALAGLEAERAQRYRDELTVLTQRLAEADPERTRNEQPRREHAPDSHAVTDDVDTAETVERPSPYAPAVAHGTLVCLNGDPPEQYRITKPVMTIGRGPHADIRIRTHLVSREHARVLNDGQTVIIQDLGSTNGIFVNSERVDSQALTDGDWVTIGESQFRYMANAIP